MRLYKRVAFTFVASVTNLVPSFLAVNVLNSIGREITVFVICVVFASSLSTMQWEREGQAGDLNSGKFDLVVIVCSLLAYYVLLATLGVSSTPIQTLIVAFSVWLASNIHVFSGRCSCRGSNSVFAVALLVRVVGASAAGLWLVFQSAVTFDDFLMVNLASLLLVSFGLVAMGAPKKSFSEPPVNLVGAYITIVDFVKGQSWVLMSWAFVAAAPISVVYFIRQVLGPVALLLASKRSSLFDYALENGHAVGRLYVGVVSYYLLAVACAVALSLAALFFSWVEPGVVAVAWAWLLLILTQDIRAYFSRTEAFGLRRALMFPFVSVIPVLTVSALSVGFTKLDTSALILSVWLGELAVLYVFWKKIDEDRRVT